MDHTRGKPHHPMTQGKIERYHRSMKNRVLLENHYLSSELEARLATIVDDYNTERLHSAIGYVTPEAKLLGREEQICADRHQRLQQARQARLATNSFRWGKIPISAEPEHWGYDHAQ